MKGENKMKKLVKGIVNIALMLGSCAGMMVGVVMEMQDNRMVAVCGIVVALVCAYAFIKALTR